MLCTPFTCASRQVERTYNCTKTSLVTFNILCAMNIISKESNQCKKRERTTKLPRRYLSQMEGNCASVTKFFRELFQTCLNLEQLQCNCVLKDSPFSINCCLGKSLKRGRLEKCDPWEPKETWTDNGEGDGNQHKPLDKGESTFKGERNPGQKKFSERNGNHEGCIRKQVTSLKPGQKSFLAEEKIDQRTDNSHSRLGHDSSTSSRNHSRPRAHFNSPNQFTNSIFSISNSFNHHEESVMVNPALTIFQTKEDATQPPGERSKKTPKKTPAKKSPDKSKSSTKKRTPSTDVATPAIRTRSTTPKPVKPVSNPKAGTSGVGQLDKSKDKSKGKGKGKSKEKARQPSAAEIKRNKKKLENFETIYQLAVAEDKPPPELVKKAKKDFAPRNDDAYVNSLKQTRHSRYADDQFVKYFLIEITHPARSIEESEHEFKEEKKPDGKFTGPDLKPIRIFLSENHVKEMKKLVRKDRLESLCYVYLNRTTSGLNQVHTAEEGYGADVKPFTWPIHRKDVYRLPPQLIRIHYTADCQIHHDQRAHYLVNGEIKLANRTMVMEIGRKGIGSIKYTANLGVKVQKLTKEAKVYIPDYEHYIPLALDPQHPEHQFFEMTLSHYHHREDIKWPISREEKYVVSGQQKPVVGMSEDSKKNIVNSTKKDNKDRRNSSDKKSKEPRVEETPKPRQQQYKPGPMSSKVGHVQAKKRLTYQLEEEAKPASPAEGSGSDEDQDKGSDEDPDKGSDEDSDEGSDEDGVDDDKVEETPSRRSTRSQSQPLLSPLVDNLRTPSKNQEGREEPSTSQPPKKTTKRKNEDDDGGKKKKKVKTSEEKGDTDVESEDSEEMDEKQREILANLGALKYQEQKHFDNIQLPAKQPAKVLSLAQFPTNLDANGELTDCNACQGNLWVDEGGRHACRTIGFEEYEIVAKESYKWEEEWEQEPGGGKVHQKERMTDMTLNRMVRKMTKEVNGSESMDIMDKLWPRFYIGEETLIKTDVPSGKYYVNEPFVSFMNGLAGSFVRKIMIRLLGLKEEELEKLAMDKIPIKKDEFFNQNLKDQIKLFDADHVVQLYVETIHGEPVLVHYNFEDSNGKTVGRVTAKATYLTLCQSPVPEVAAIGLEYLCRKALSGDASKYAEHHVYGRVTYAKRGTKGNDAIERRAIGNRYAEAIGELIEPFEMLAELYHRNLRINTLKSGQLWGSEAKKRYPWAVYEGLKGKAAKLFVDTLYPKLTRKLKWYCNDQLATDDQEREVRLYVKTILQAVQTAIKHKDQGKQLKHFAKSLQEVRGKGEKKVGLAWISAIVDLAHDDQWKTCGKNAERLLWKDPLAVKRNGETWDSIAQPESSNNSDYELAKDELEGDPDGEMDPNDDQL